MRMNTPSSMKLKDSIVKVPRHSWPPLRDESRTNFLPSKRTGVWGFDEIVDQGKSLYSVLIPGHCGWPLLR